MAGANQTGRVAIDDAKVLADIAMQIQEAETAETMIGVLTRNFEFWSVIKYRATNRSDIPEGIRGGLIKLADYVTATILGAEKAPLTEDQIHSLVTINLRVSAGLIEGQIRGVMGEDAFRKWDEEGRPLSPEFEQLLEGDSVRQATAA
jgi:hypothetical protein